jgi:outer membrane lipoprotein carrier protein
MSGAMALIEALSMPGLSLATAQMRMSGTETPASPGADAAEVRSIVQGLQQHYARTHSFAADFSQQIISTAGTRTDRRGVLYYRKPGLMRWEFSEPKDEVIVSDGSTLYNYQPDLSQVIETPLAQALRSSPMAALLVGIGKLDRDFDVSIVKPQPPDGLLHLILNPKTGGERLELALSHKSYDLASLKVIDQLGNQTFFGFSNIKNNPALNDVLFSFKAPPGADIVESPGFPRGR